MADETMDLGQWADDVARREAAAEDAQDRRQERERMRDKGWDQYPTFCDACKTTCGPCAGTVPCFPKGDVRARWGGRNQRRSEP